MLLLIGLMKEDYVGSDVVSPNLDRMKGGVVSIECVEAASVVGGVVVSENFIRGFLPPDDVMSCMVSLSLFRAKSRHTNR